MTEYKRTEFTGQKDTYDRDICCGDILITDDKEYLRCEKDGDTWIYVNIETGAIYKELPVSATIIVFDCEEV